MEDPYAWTEQDGIWKRNLGSMEAFYLSLASPKDHPVHWMIGSGISLTHHGTDTTDIVPALKQAWKTTCRRHPNLLAEVDPINQSLVIDTNHEASSINDSFLVHTGTTAKHLFSNFKSQFCITLHFIRDTNELVVQAMHALLDGRGILYLFHALFSALSEAGKEEQSEHTHDIVTQSRLSKPLDAWLSLSQTPSQQNMEAAQALFTRFVQDKPVRLPGVDFGSLPRTAEHRELSLSVQTTEQIIKGCKSRGITVTTAWHTALVLAVKKLQTKHQQPGTSYVQFTTIDLRRWFPSPFHKSTDSIASLQTALPFAIHCPNDSDFNSISKVLQNEYKDPFAFADGDLGCLQPGMAMYRQTVAAGQVQPSSTPYLSSMGVVDDILRARYGDWELGGYWVSSTMLTGDFQVYLWTWRAQMVLSACYNDAFYEADQVDGILGAVRDELETGLGLS